MISLHSVRATIILIVSAPLLHGAEIYRAEWIRREDRLLSTLKSPAPAGFVARKNLIDHLQVSEDGAVLLPQEEA